MIFAPPPLVSSRKCKKEPDLEFRHAQGGGGENGQYKEAK